MNCTRLAQVLDAYLDSELDRATGEEIAQHLAHCPACTGLRSGRDALKQRLRSQAPYFVAPAALGPAVHRSLTAALDGTARRMRRPSWVQAGALATVAAVVSALAGYWLAQPLPDATLREQVVASHVAALNDVRKLTAITSVDQHVVKPWFQGKIDFAPVVRDLSAEGYALVGARLDHVANRQAVAVVYRVRNHFINLFIWRAAADAPEALAVSSVRGFGVATWAGGGLRFGAASDIDTRELEHFARLVQAPQS